MKEGVCGTSADEVGCSSNILYKLEPYCNGRLKCSFDLAALVVSIYPCERRDLRSYLHVEYTCRKGNLYNKKIITKKKKRKRNKKNKKEIESVSFIF